MPARRRHPRASLPFQSGLIGWIYFTAWSISFYPQVFINARRRSVVGLSFEYPALNLVGFSCYTAFNSALFWSPSVRAAYRDAHNGDNPSVQSNDVFFGIHAVALTLIVLVQICVYERGDQRLALWCAAVLIVLLSIIGGVAAATAAHASPNLDWLQYFTILSYVKLSISEGARRQAPLCLLAQSNVAACARRRRRRRRRHRPLSRAASLLAALMKYFPQAFLNWRRQSTVGWSIENILLDFTGGSLSLAQSLMDNSIPRGSAWANILGGNPAKFFLGFTSMVFDIVFMVQHYGLYRENNARLEAEEEEARGGYSALVGDKAASLNDAA